MDERMLRKLSEIMGADSRALTAEQRAEQASAAFNRVLDHALNGACPGALDDPAHGVLEEATVAYLKSTMHEVSMLPAAVVDAVVRVAAYKMTHIGQPGDVLKQLTDGGGLADAFLAAGATLRAVEAASKAGISLSTGNYL